MTSKNKSSGLYVTHFSWRVYLIIVSFSYMVFGIFYVAARGHCSFLFMSFATVIVIEANFADVVFVQMGTTDP
jgi:hypothetical protein